MSKGKVLMGTVAGIAIGALAGVLLAPDKGSRTRKQIMDRGNDYVDDLKHKFDEFRDTVSDKFKTASREADELVDKGKANYYDAKSDVKSAASDFKKDSSSDFKNKTM